MTYKKRRRKSLVTKYRIKCVLENVIVLCSIWIENGIIYKWISEEYNIKWNEQRKNNTKNAHKE